MATPDCVKNISYERICFVYNLISSITVERATLLISILSRDLSVGGWTCPCGCGAIHHDVFSSSVTIITSLTIFIRPVLGSETKRENSTGSGHERS